MARSVALSRSNDRRAATTPGGIPEGGVGDDVLAGEAAAGLDERGEQVQESFAAVGAVGGPCCSVARVRRHRGARLRHGWCDFVDAAGTGRGRALEQDGIVGGRPAHRADPEVVTRRRVRARRGWRWSRRRDAGRCRPSARSASERGARPLRPTAGTGTDRSGPSGDGQGRDRVVGDPLVTFARVGERRAQAGDRLTAEPRGRVEDRSHLDAGEPEARVRCRRCPGP